MKIKKTRYVVEVYTKEGIKQFALFDTATGEGTSGEGIAFQQARKALKEKGIVAPFTVHRVEISAEIDVKKAVEAGAITDWKITNDLE